MKKIYLKPETKSREMNRFVLLAGSDDNHLDNSENEDAGAKEIGGFLDTEWTIESAPDS